MHGAAPDWIKRTCCSLLSDPENAGDIAGTNKLKDYSSSKSTLGAASIMA